MSFLSSGFRNFVMNSVRDDVRLDDITLSGYRTSYFDKNVKHINNNLKPNSTFKEFTTDEKDKIIEQILQHEPTKKSNEKIYIPNAKIINLWTAEYDPRTREYDTRTREYDSSTTRNRDSIESNEEDETIGDDEALQEQEEPIQEIEISKNQLPNRPSIQSNNTTTFKTEDLLQRKEGSYSSNIRREIQERVLDGTNQTQQEESGGETNNDIEVVEI